MIFSFEIATIDFSFDFFIMAGMQLAALLARSHPFNYDLHPIVIPGKSSKIMLCFHGFGGDYRDAEKVKVSGYTLISFNLPDFGIEEGKYAPEKTSFGTFDELAPAFYLLKSCVIDANIQEMNLYGFSAGGGAVINLLATLKNPTHDASLESIGIYSKEKEKILQALQRGIIILDSPLKSMEEIMDLRGSSPAFQLFTHRYQKNHFRPIDSLRYLDGFNVILHFQNPDEILSNRDDDLFIDRIRANNSHGTMSVVKGFDGGHHAFHASLWEFFQKWNKTDDS